MSYLYIIVNKATAMVLKATWDRQEANQYMDNLNKLKVKYQFNEVLIEPTVLNNQTAI